MPGDLYVLQPILGNGTVVTRVFSDHDQVRREDISGFQLAQHRFRLDLVSHHHRFHVALDHVAIDVRRVRLRIDGHNFPGEVIVLRFLGLRTLAGAAKHGYYNKNADKQDTAQTTILIVHDVPNVTLIVSRSPQGRGVSPTRLSHVCPSPLEVALRQSRQ